MCRSNWTFVCPHPHRLSLCFGLPRPDKMLSTRLLERFHSRPQSCPVRNLHGYPLPRAGPPTFGLPNGTVFCRDDRRPKQPVSTEVGARTGLGGNNGPSSRGSRTPIGPPGHTLGERHRLRPGRRSRPIGPWFEPRLQASVNWAKLITCKMADSKREGQPPGSRNLGKRGFAGLGDAPGSPSQVAS